MNWILLALNVAFIVAGIAGWLVARHELDAGQNFKAQRDKLNTENDMLHKAQVVLEEARMQSYAENADLREALQEAQAEIKSLNMNTIEVQKVTPEPEQAVRYQSVLDTGKPESVKRTRKKGAQA